MLPREIATVGSTALAQWRSSGLSRLAELEAVHVNLTGNPAGSVS